jgi:hypothetical protein
MARVYMITEEEMQSLLDSLELSKLRQQNAIEKHAPEWFEIDKMHRSFHFVAVRWAQSVGFDGYRKS